LEELVTELMCHLHPQQAEQQSAGQCDITRNAEHDGRTIVVYDLLNGAIVNDLERSLPPVARSRHSLTLNIS